ncbi:YdcF family protein [Desulfitobacterium sp.]|uniref:YdcF family protein n=1 Tax=Desulfitobacterium sp. TaxID=49981 RepID=UPI002B21494E|nr:YdcF family protein [Desulfitobacterium sp.]MEA4902437.1 YdcF family protein [Desulfitobacterium sp.]
MNNRVSRICILIGIIGILDTICVLGFNGGLNLGTLLPGVLGIALVFWGLAGNYLKQHVLKDRYRRLRRLLRAGVLLLLASFIVIESLLLYHTRDPIPSQVDYLIILGAGLNGEQLSWTLWERVDKGLKILQDNQEMRVVVSGGQGPGEWITEAEAMQRYLVEHGIAPERILKEEKSTSTMENFRYSRKLLEQQPSYDPSEPVLVITNDFHMFRSKILARRNGINPVGVPSPTPWYLRPNVYLREYFAVVKSLVFDR